MSGRGNAAEQREPLAHVRRVTLVLPCLNEADSVGDCIDEARTAAEANAIDLEVIIVDNGSTDGSAAVAARHGAIVIDEPRRGYGRALKTGILHASSEVVVMADADGTYPLERVPELVAGVFAGEADLVIGERLQTIAPGAMPLLHRFVGTPVLSFLVRRATRGLRVADSQSGFRAFSRRRVLELGLRSDGMEFASEMLIRAGGRGLAIKSIQTGYRPRVGESKLNTFTDGVRHLQLIGLLAPQLMLFWPGLALLSVGLGMTGVSLVQPQGIAVGSVRWQPVFFSGIAVVVGLLGTLAGAVLAFHSSVADDSVRRHFRFVGHTRFDRRCIAAGVAASALGLLIDAWLFVIWARELPTPSRALALASLAQSLILAGSVAVVFGIINALINRSRGDELAEQGDRRAAATEA